MKTTFYKRALLVPHTVKFTSVLNSCFWWLDSSKNSLFTVKDFHFHELLAQYGDEINHPDQKFIIPESPIIYESSSEQVEISHDTLGWGNVSYRKLDSINQARWVVETSFIELPDIKCNLITVVGTCESKNPSMRQPKSTPGIVKYLNKFMIAEYNSIPCKSAIHVTGDLRQVAVRMSKNTDLPIITIDNDRISPKSKARLCNILQGTCHIVIGQNQTYLGSRIVNIYNCGGMLSQHLHIRKFIQ